jgi:hypothetical protein
MSLQNVIDELKQKNNSLTQQRKQIFSLYCKIWLHNVIDDLKPQTVESLPDNRYQVKLQLGERFGGIAGTLQGATLYFAKDVQEKSLPLKTDGGVPVVPDVYALGEFLMSVQNW